MKQDFERMKKHNGKDKLIFEELEHYEKTLRSPIQKYEDVDSYYCKTYDELDLHKEANYRKRGYY